MGPLPAVTEPEKGASGAMPGAPAVCGLLGTEVGAGPPERGALGSLASVVAPLRGAAAAVVLGWVTCAEDAPEEAVAGGEALGAVPTVGEPLSAEFAEREPAASGAEVPEACVLEPGLFTAGGDTFCGDATLGIPAMGPLAGVSDELVMRFPAVDSLRWSSPHAASARRARAEVSVRAARMGSLDSVVTDLLIVNGQGGTGFAPPASHGRQPAGPGGGHAPARAQHERSHAARTSKPPGASPPPPCIREAPGLPAAASLRSAASTTASPPMPRLFTGLEIPPEIGAALARHRGGLPGARWVEPENYHVTLRFVGDVDEGVARDLTAALEEARPREAIPIVLDGLSTFGGRRPHAIFANVAPSAALSELQAEHESIARRVGLSPETRKFHPHVTLARLRNVSSLAVADHLALQGPFERLGFTARRVALYSARDSVGGGPYVVEAAYPLS